MNTTGDDKRARRRRRRRQRRPGMANERTFAHKVPPPGCRPCQMCSSAGSFMRFQLHPYCPQFPRIDLCVCENHTRGKSRLFRITIKCLAGAEGTENAEKPSRCAALIPRGRAQNAFPPPPVWARALAQSLLAQNNFRIYGLTSRCDCEIYDIRDGDRKRAHGQNTQNRRSIHAPASIHRHRHRRAGDGGCRRRDALRQLEMARMRRAR